MVRKDAARGQEMLIVGARCFAAGSGKETTTKTRDADDGREGRREAYM